ncbi:hypothetical protein [Mycobacterium sp. UM_Kg1]|nr:hypothetical protein [Mycobacterium sp. UM_Kg1]
MSSTRPALRAAPDRAEAVLASHRLMQKLLGTEPGNTDAPAAD